jgi:hypothetical protein
MYYVFAVFNSIFMIKKIKQQCAEVSWALLLLCFQDVSGSKLCMEIDCPK